MNHEQKLAVSVAACIIAMQNAIDVINYNECNLPFNNDLGERLGDTFIKSLKRDILALADLSGLSATK